MEATEYHAGDVWGTWTKATSPHIITADLRIPPGQSLTIEPGCQVLFRGYYKLVVDSAAILRAIGTVSDSILFDEETPGTAWHGIRFLKADNTSALSYCRLRHGKALGEEADGYGGALYCLGSSPTLRYCLVDGNYARARGGALYCENGNPRLEYCQFLGDSASPAPVCSEGGALHFRYSEPTLIGNTFRENIAMHGGAIYAECAGDSLTIVNNDFTTNLTWEDGAAIQGHGTSHSLISGNNFNLNHASSEAGAVYCHTGFSALIVGNTFTSNSCNYNGGAILCIDASPTITGNTFAENSAVSYGNGGAIDCGNPYSDVHIAGNSFYSNYAAHGGAISFSAYPGATVLNNIFESNTAAYGGAVWLNNGAEVEMRDNVFLANDATALSGGAIYIYWATATIRNCTFYGNRAAMGGAINCEYITSPVLTNCILWADSATLGPEIRYDPKTCDPVVSYCDIQGGWTGSGGNNLDTSPYFINAPEGILQLQHSSPCIDAGDPASPLDPDNTRADMGAYYFDQSTTPSLQFYPHHTPITLPPTLSHLEYDGWVYNLADTSVTVDIWTYAILPNHSRYGPVRHYTNSRIRPHARIGMNNIEETVPGMAPAGDYSYIGYVGKFPSTVLDSSYFGFTKSP
jgi:predicted outer membrane repeat protein